MGLLTNTQGQASPNPTLPKNRSKQEQETEHSQDNLDPPTPGPSIPSIPTQTHGPGLAGTDPQGI